MLPSSSSSSKVTEPAPSRPDVATDSEVRGDGEPPSLDVGPPLELEGGLILFSFCLLLQNQTLTTSFSIQRESARWVISSEVGFGFWRKALSRDTLTVVSILVRFFRRRPIASAWEWLLQRELGLLREASASFSHRSKSGFSLHMFLKLKLRASNRDIVV